MTSVGLMGDPFVFLVFSSKELIKGSRCLACLMRQFIKPDEELRILAEIIGVTCVEVYG